jgi:hypothetical protein
MKKMDKRYDLTKSKVMSGLQCHKRLWLELHKRELAEYSTSSQLMMMNGNEVGELARTTIVKDVNAHLIQHVMQPMEAVAVTAERLVGIDDITLYEAAFLHHGVLVRSDILTRTDDGYEVIEVKSSTKVKEYYLQDAAIQYWVMKMAGVPVTKFEIAHINNQFVYAGDDNYEGLFKRVDITEKTQRLAQRVPQWIEDQMALVHSDEPVITMGEQCSTPFECPFGNYCGSLLPVGPRYPVDILPGNSAGLVQRLKALGYEDLSLVPEDELYSDTHKRIARVSASGNLELDHEAGLFLRAQSYPRYYLDFETINYAVPKWMGTRPYTQIPFQWSCHVESQNGQIDHQEFLDLTGSDPSRAFSEKLISTIGDIGPIFVYNATFEKGRLKELAARFPSLSKPLLDMVSRVIDLYPLTKKHYYHPDMMGSWSIKRVLPTIASDLSYDNLSGVQDGGGAQDAYIKATLESCSHDQRIALRASLLKYCQRDTEAMVRLAAFLSGTPSPMHV